MEDSEQPPEYGLVMPFVNVTSQGGRYDDDAYCAGWEMGHLDAQLGYQQPPTLERTIRDGNTEQADLIAMQYGYRADIEPCGVDGWLHLRLTLAPATLSNP